MSTSDPEPAVPVQRPEDRASADEVAAAGRHQREERLAAAIISLQQAGRRGANWFYWVAGLSVLNSLLIHLGANIYFVVGLGVSLVADSLASHLAQQNPDQGVLFRGVAIGFTILVSGIVVLFGWLANRRYLSVFALAMVLYVLDGLIFLLFQDFLSVAFHAYALFCMASGWNAYRKVNQIEKQLRLATDTGEVVPQGDS
jgi:hypothetical protein